ncbi:MAG TPA: hypothetical protein VIU38_14865 [Anaerolineales bacterium]
MPVIVRIDERYEVTSRIKDPPIAVGPSSVRGCKVADFAPIRLNDRRRGIRRAVIDNEHFEYWVCLTEYRIKRFTDPPSCIVGTNDD